MRVVAAIFLTLILAGAAWGLVYAVLENKRKSLVAGAPPAALVGESDSRAVAKAKLTAYSRYLDAMHLLDQVRREDTTLTFLSIDLRKEIDEALDQFYGKQN